MAGLFTGSENYNVKNGAITKVNNSNKMPGLSSLGSSPAKSTPVVSALTGVGQGRTVVDKAGTPPPSYAASNTGNLTDANGMITPRPGGRLNEAEVQSNAALSAARAQATINQSDQYTPYGSSTWTRDPVTGQGTNTVSLDPAQQALLDAETSTQTKLSNVGSTLADQVAADYSKPLDFSGTPQIDYQQTQKNVARPDLQQSIQPYGTIQNSIQGAGDITGSIADAGGIQRQVDTSGINPLSYSANKGNIQGQIDMSGVPSLVGGQDLLGFQNTARDAAWNNAKAALDPQWNQYETGLETKLANQGVVQGSDAWNNAISGMSRNRQYDYSQAQNNAVNQGLTAAQQLYGQGLSSNQNAYGQALGRGNFANSAQNQDYSQNLSNAQLGNAASMGMFNARRGVMADANSAQGQQFGQNQASSAFGNTAQAQRFGQNQAGAEFGNAAQAQGFGQNATNAAFGNTAAQAGFDMDSQNAALNNAGINQDFTNSTNYRNQNINELMQQRGDSLSALSSIMNGTQPTMPQFGSTNVVGGIESPNTMNGLTATKNANAATTAAKYGALGNIASSALKIAKIPGLG